MKILMTNVQLDQRTGTEIVVRDLESSLRGRGHEVCVYTPSPGPLADQIVAAGGTVVSDIANVPFTPDVIHGHHHMETSQALVRFPSAAAVFVCHDRTSPTDVPVLSARIGRYVSVDLNCDERVAIETAVPAERRLVVHNAVDLARHPRREELPARPRRALAFSNNAEPGGYVEQIRVACAQRGISLEVIGSGAGTTSFAPEEVLGDYDLVFAKARSALEALATGCAVVLADAGGLGGLVTMEEVAPMRDWNFGARCLQGPVTSERVGQEIDRYDAARSSLVTDWIREVADLERAVDSYLDVYRAVRAEPALDGPPTTWAELHRSLLGHASVLEGLVRDLEGGAVAPLIPPSIGREISVELLGPPALVGPGEVVQISVEVRNRSSEVLSGRGPHPVHLAHRWVDDAGDPLPGEPERTPLVSSIGPGATLRQSIRVRTPEEVGRHRLRPDIVQEGQFWFSHLPGFEPVAWDLSVTTADLGSPWTLGRAAELVALEVVRDATFAGLDFAGNGQDGTLTFAESGRFVELAARNAGTTGMLVPRDLVEQVDPRLGIAACDDPRATFARLHEVLAARTDFYGVDEPTHVDPRARVHPSVHVDPVNVVIGPRASIGPNAVLSGRVRIGADVVVGAGAVLGSAGFQTVDVDGAPIEMVHAGGVEVGAGSVVFANAVVASGLFRRDTVIGAGARVGNGAFVSHNTVVGGRSFVGHGAVVNGNVVVGADAWIGPGATITNNISLGDGCRVSLGATVFGDVAPGDHVSGMAAVDHRVALRATAELRRRR